MEFISKINMMKYNSGVSRRVVSLSFFLLFVEVLLAQQPLNLNFERLGPAHERPWGWSIDQNTAVDSTTSHDGRRSLRMNSDSDSNMAFANMLIEPFELTNREITIEGWIRTNDLAGFTFLSLSYWIMVDGIDKKVVFKSDSINSNSDWILIQVKGTIDSESSSIQFGLHMTGSGIVWFDDFKLNVDGRYLDQVQIAQPYTETQLDWIKDRTHSLRTYNATSLGEAVEKPFSDLEFFTSSFGEARIIAMGESTHGTSEFFRLKHRMLEYSVEKLGVRIFAIEDHQLVVKGANDFVNGGEGTARSSMKGMFSVWQNREVEDLIQWMRNYNDKNPFDKVRFVGFDIQNHSLAIDSLFRIIEKRFPQNLDDIKRKLNHLRQNGNQSYLMTDSIRNVWYESSSVVVEEVKQLFPQNDQPSRDAIQIALLIKQFAENAFRGHASLYRDVAMAENVIWHLNQFPHSKMLLWAHDAHVSLGEHPDSLSNIYSRKSMGANLRKRLGTNYRSFGISTYKGDYWAQLGYTDFRFRSCPLLPSPEGSVAHALHWASVQNESPYLFFDLKESRSQDWMIRNSPVRFANHVNNEYGYWTRYSIPYQFDGIFFIDETSAANSYAGK